MDILTLAVAKNSASSTPGQKGDTGNGIKSTVMNDDYTLTIEFTDGTSYTTPSIRGEKGETGSKGAKGDKGDKGDSGTNGTDWNQNDPTSPDYVKNRLAWTDDPVETVLFDGTVVNDDSIDIELIVGQEYVVTFDGVEYVLTAQGMADAVFIGSESLWCNNDYIDTEPPFVFGIYDDGGSWFYTISSEEEYEDEHSLKIVADIAEVHKLDEKYLPNTVLTSSTKYPRHIVTNCFMINKYPKISCEVENTVTENVTLDTWKEFANMMLDDNYVCMFQNSLCMDIQPTENGEISEDFPSGIVFNIITTIIAMSRVDFFYKSMELLYNEINQTVEFSCLLENTIMQHPIT